MEIIQFITMLFKCWKIPVLWYKCGCFKPFVTCNKSNLWWFEKWFLITFKQIVQAEVFDSELEQAKSLLESGYKNAAAVIAGVVLETAIKELCLNNGIDIERKKINSAKWWFSES